MILPIGDDNPRETTPYVHYTIMAVNIAVFVFFTAGHQTRAFYQDWGLVPAQFSISRVFTSMYLHGGLGHLFFNMLFLWIVGDNVEDRVGHLGYFVFYHAAGVAACLAHVAFHPQSMMPVVGASGAISGMMGAYAAFFPQAKIKIWYWLFLFFMNVVYVSAKWAVGLWFLLQLLLWALTGGREVAGVAYEAHIGGLVFGVVAALVLRATVLRGYDTVRRIVRPRTAEGQVRWTTGEPEASADFTWTEPKRPTVIDVEAEPVPAASAGVEQHVEDASGIISALTAGDLALAYRYFTRATGGYRHVTLEAPLLMRLGEALVMSGRYGPAARVYEVMLETHPVDDGAAEAAFLLGTILSREFRDYARARTYLNQAAGTHRDLDRRRRAVDELKRIDSYLRSTLLSRSPSAKVWIIRQTDDAIDVERVAHVVADRVGGAQTEIADRLAASRGLIAADVPRGEAKTLAADLQRIGVPVLIIPSSEVVQPAPAVRSNRAALSVHGVRFHISGHTVLKTWQETRLMACGCVGSGTAAKRVMDFFFSDAEHPTHVRLREREFVFSTPESPGRTSRDVELLCQTLESIAKDVPMNRGMFLAEHPSADAAWDDLRFATDREFDSYTLWFLQLVGAGKMTSR